VSAVDVVIEYAQDRNINKQPMGCDTQLAVQQDKRGDL